MWPFDKSKNHDSKPGDSELGPDMHSGFDALSEQLGAIRGELDDLDRQGEALSAAYQADECSRKHYDTETDWLTMRRQSLLRRQQEILAKIDTTTSRLARLALRDQPDNE